MANGCINEKQKADRKNRAETLCTFTLMIKFAYFKRGKMLTFFSLIFNSAHPNMNCTVEVLV